MRWKENGIKTLLYLIDGISTGKLIGLFEEHGQEILVSDGYALNIGNELIVPASLNQEAHSAFIKKNYRNNTDCIMGLCSTLYQYLEMKREIADTFPLNSRTEGFKYAEKKMPVLDFSDFNLVQLAYDTTLAFMYSYADSYDYEMKAIEELAALLAIEMLENLQKDDLPRYYDIEKMASTLAGRYSFKEGFSALRFLEDNFRDIEGINEYGDDEEEDEEEW